MSRKNLTLDDAAFLAGLQRVVQQKARSSRGVVGAVGAEVAKAARSAAPSDTGRMRRSIKSQTGIDRRGPYAEISVGPFYSSFVEWGTVEHSAQPFFRPALEQVRRLLTKHRAELSGSGSDFSMGDGRVDYTTRSGRTIRATHAQVTHWTRGRR